MSDQKNLTIILNLDEGPAFITGLVREGVTWTARSFNGHLIITLTGGY